MNIIRTINNILLTHIFIINSLDKTFFQRLFVLFTVLKLHERCHLTGIAFKVSLEETELTAQFFVNSSATGFCNRILQQEKNAN